MSRFAAAVLVLMACNNVGPVGPQGPAGPTGPQGPGFEAAPSISAVSPRFAVVGGTLDVALSGFATQWSMGAQVNFGSGITVNRVVAASGTSLIVNITVGANASVGKRDLSVTEAGTTSTYKGVFEVKPLFEVKVKGVAWQGGLVTVQLKVNDPAFTFSPIEGQTVAAYTNYGGLNVLSSALDTQTVEQLIGIDVDAAVGARDLVVTAYPRTSREKIFRAPAVFTIAARTATPLAIGMGTATFSAPYDTALFKVDANVAGLLTSTTSVANAALSFAVIGQDEVWDSPSDPFFTTQRFIDSLASNEVGPTTVYVVLYDASGTAGAATVNFTQPPSVTEMEPNDAQPMAQGITAPQHVSATISAGEQDWYKLTVPAELVGHTLRYTSPRLTDVKVDIISGTTSLTPGSGPYDSDPENFSSSPIPTAGDVFIQVQGYSSTTTGDYEFTVYFE